MASFMADQFPDTLEDKWNPDLREWYTPPFATTTDSDKVVGSVLTMENMRKHCTYAVDLTCGIPSVTLLGERQDWVNLMGKMQDIPYIPWTGEEVAEFEDLLRPVLRLFVASFDEPESPEVQSFWRRCAHGRGDGSSATHLTGWITLLDTEKDLLPALLGKVNLRSISRGYATVPVSLCGGMKEEQNAIMLAGSVGIIATTSSEQPPGENENPLPSPTSSSRGDPCSLDTIQPLSAWWVYKVKVDDFW
ncbi:unnamed protein product [Penicillium salamii]|uniref:Uncharacterized protein n=1 Tax=Penicillium salamii TaxID=1612424 RepID=A0A9W4IZV6_9EURO|nr:unnamed protein product [Penicillium salamii]